MTKIACVACLDPKISIHTPRFLRAVGLAKTFALGANAQVDLYNDLASADGAIAAAKQIIAAKPDIVVGHYASSAAMAAAPLYAKANIPLILPAATRSDLTQHKGVRRVCDNDADYVAWLCDAINMPIHGVHSDGSAHGDSVVDMVRKSTAFAPQSRPETILISGLYNITVAYAGRCRAKTIILTDDADAPGLADDLVAAGVDFNKTRVFVGALVARPTGPIAARIRAVYGTDPGTYFWETIAALQIANGQSDTVLGQIDFDAQGEASPRGFRLYAPEPNRVAA
jgi:hypothetical protein